MFIYLYIYMYLFMYLFVSLFTARGVHTALLGVEPSETWLGVQAL